MPRSPSPRDRRRTGGHREASRRQRSRERDGRRSRSPRRRSRSHSRDRYHRDRDHSRHYSRYHHDRERSRGSQGSFIPSRERESSTGASLAPARTRDEAPTIQGVEDAPRAARAAVNAQVHPERLRLLAGAASAPLSTNEVPRHGRPRHTGGGRRSALPEAPPVGSVHKGKVLKVQSFGCFVEIPGYWRHGMVHISQLADFRVERVEDAVAVGDEVWVKVLSVEDGPPNDDGTRQLRVGLSMKLVSQTDGRDLDPNGELREEEDRKRGPKGHVYENERIQLGAVLNVTCRKCGARGHLASECYSAGGEQSYSILPDTDEGAGGSESAVAPNTDPRVAELKDMKRKLEILHEASKRDIPRDQRKRFEDEYRKLKRRRHELKKEVLHAMS